MSSQLITRSSHALVARERDRARRGDAEGVGADPVVAPRERAHRDLAAGAHGVVLDAPVRELEPHGGADREPEQRVVHLEARREQEQPQADLLRLGREEALLRAVDHARSGHHHPLGGVRHERGPSGRRSPAPPGCPEASRAVWPRNVRRSPLLPNSVTESTTSGSTVLPAEIDEPESHAVVQVERRDAPAAVPAVEARPRPGVDAGREGAHAPRRPDRRPAADRPGRPRPPRSGRRRPRTPSRAWAGWSGSRRERGRRPAPGRGPGPRSEHDRQGGERRRRGAPPAGAADERRPRAGPPRRTRGR